MMSQIANSPLASYLTRYSNGQHFVFQKSFESQDLDYLFGLPGTRAAVSYNDFWLATDKTKSIPYTKSAWPRSRLRTWFSTSILVFQEMPDFHWLKNNAANLFKNGIRTFVWVHIHGTHAYSFLSMGLLYASFRVNHLVAHVSYRADIILNLLPRRRLRSSLKFLLKEFHGYQFHSRKVLLVISQLESGGAERQFTNTAVALQNDGSYHPIVVCANLSSIKQPLASRERLISFHVPIHEASNTSIHKLPTAILERLKPVLTAFYSDPDLAELTFRLTSEIYETKPQVVHAWMDHVNITAGIAALVAGVPRIILSCRNVAPTHFDYYRAIMRPAYELLSRSKNVQFLNNSKAGALDYQRWLAQASLKTIVVPNGFDTREFPPVSVTEKSRVRHLLNIRKEHYPIIGYVGRFSSEKCPILWLRIARLLKQTFPNALFVLSGTGPLKAKILQTIKRLNLSDCTILPGLFYEPNAMYANLDCLLLTSKYEGVPNVLLEAQWYGVPIVTRDAGGASETILDGTTGILVSGNSPKDYVAATQSILNNQRFQTEGQDQGPRFIKEHFDLSTMTSNTITAYTTTGDV